MDKEHLNNTDHDVVNAAVPEPSPQSTEEPVTSPSRDPESGMPSQTDKIPNNDHDPSIPSEGRGVQGMNMESGLNPGYYKSTPGFEEPDREGHPAEPRHQAPGQVMENKERSDGEKPDPVPDLPHPPSEDKMPGQPLPDAEMPGRQTPDAKMPGRETPREDIPEKEPPTQKLPGQSPPGADSPKTF